MSITYDLGLNCAIPIQVPSSTALAATSVRARSSVGPSIIRPRHPSVIFAGHIRGGWSVGVGVTTSGGLITQIADQGSGGFNMTASGAQRPTLNTSDTDFADGLSATFDGSGNFLGNASIDLPAPGTSPTYMRFLVKPGTHTSGAHLCGQASNTMAITMAAASPNLNIRNTTAITNGGAPNAAWSRGRVQLTNNATDKFRLRSTEVTGNAGNTDPAAGFGIGARSALGGSLCAMTWRCWYLLDAAPTADQDTEFDLWCNWVMKGVTTATT